MNITTEQEYQPWRNNMVLFLARNSKATDPYEKMLSLWLADQWDIDEDAAVVTSKEIQKALGFAARRVSTLNKELKDWKVIIEPGQVPRYEKNFNENAYAIN